MLLKPLSALQAYSRKALHARLLGVEIASDEDGTLPPDTRTPQPQAGMSRQAAPRLAQEAGKAVAHCCLAFMEIQAGGWRLPSGTGNGRSHAGRSAAGERHEVASLGEGHPDA